MRSLRIAVAMKSAMLTDACSESGILNYGAVVYDPAETTRRWNRSTLMRDEAHRLKLSILVSRPMHFR